MKLPVYVHVHALTVNSHYAFRLSCLVNGCRIVLCVITAVFGVPLIIKFARYTDVTNDAIYGRE